MTSTSTPGGETTPPPAPLWRPAAPRPATAAAAERFLRGLAWAIVIEPTPKIGWAQSRDDAGPNLWDLYRGMSEPLRAALREGWTHFVVRLPRGAAAAAAQVTDLLAEPGPAAWFAKFLAAAPWLDPETADLDGPAYEKLLHRRRRGRMIRRNARRRLDLRARTVSRPPPAASSPPTTMPVAPSARLGAATMTLRELTRWLRDLGETKQGGAKLTEQAVRGRIRRPANHPPEYAAFAAVRDAGNRRFPKLQTLRILDRCAQRLGAERAAMTTLAAAIQAEKRLQDDGVLPRRPR